MNKFSFIITSPCIGNSAGNYKSAGNYSSAGNCQSLSFVLVVIATVILANGSFAATSFAQEETPEETQEEAAATSEPVESDERVKKVLEETGLKYETDNDGDYKIRFNYDDGRSQMVFINSATETYGEMEIREVWAVGYVSEKDKVPASIAAKLIRANAEVKMGGWQIQKVGEKEVAVFRVTVAADADVKTLQTALKLVGISADEKEAELSDDDEL